MTDHNMAKNVNLDEIEITSVEFTTEEVQKLFNYFNVLNVSFIEKEPFMNMFRNAVKSAKYNEFLKRQSNEESLNKE